MLFINVLFFLLLNTISINIILAIIVDTYSELRDKEDEKGI